MNILLVYNPKSGHQSFTHALDFVVKRVQEEGYQLLLYRLDGYKELGPYFDTVQFDTVDRIWIAGGDGTLNTVVNELLKREIDLPIGVFPVGTANDFANYFELPRSIDEQIDIALGQLCSPADVVK